MLRTSTMHLFEITKKISLKIFWQGVGEIFWVWKNEVVLPRTEQKLNQSFERFFFFFFLQKTYFESTLSV